METRAEPVASQTFSDDSIEDIQEEADETDPTSNNDTHPEEETCCYKFLDRSLTILYCLALLVIFMLMWKYLPTPTSEYKQANEHLNGTVSHSPNYVGFSKRQNLVCNSSISIGTVLPTKMTFLPY